jgi:hypothetical protein
VTLDAPQIETLSVAKLTVDQEVQRAVDKARVDRLAKDYREAALGVIVVSRRDDGTYHVIDGQHRVSATIAAGFGDHALTCLVYEGLARADEAAMFRHLNNTRGVLAVDKFRVRVIEGDPAAVVLNDILSRHGWRVQMNKDAGAFAAVSAFESIYKGKLNGPGNTRDICDTLIRVITEAWGHDASGVRNEIVGGLGAVLLRFNTRVDLTKLVAELGQHPGGPRGLVGRAKGLHAFRGGKLADSFAEVVVEMLNKGRRVSTRLPEWRSQV